MNFISEPSWLNRVFLMRIVTVLKAETTLYSIKQHNKKTAKKRSFKLTVLVFSLGRNLQLDQMCHRAHFPRKKHKLTWHAFYNLFNPLSTKDDQHEISPYNINALENGLVMRIEYMIREDESNWCFNNFSPPLLLKKYRDNKWESQFWY